MSIFNAQVSNYTCKIHTHTHKINQNKKRTSCWLKLIISRELDAFHMEVTAAFCRINMICSLCKLSSDFKRTLVRSTPPLILLCYHLQQVRRALIKTFSRGKKSFVSLTNISFLCVLLQLLYHRTICTMQYIHKSCSGALLPNTMSRLHMKQMMSDRKQNAFV